MESISRRFALGAIAAAAIPTQALAKPLSLPEEPIQDRLRRLVEEVANMARETGTDAPPLPHLRTLTFNYVNGVIDVIVPRPSISVGYVSISFWPNEMGGIA